MYYIHILHIFIIYISYIYIYVYIYIYTVTGVLRAKKWTFMNNNCLELWTEK